MKPTKGMSHDDIIREFSDLENEREHWLELTELDNIKVARYMLEFGRKDLLDAHGGFLRDFLKGWIEDSLAQIDCYGDVGFCV